MDADKFNVIVDKQIALSTTVLVKKADEYATEDRLHNFKVAAALESITTEQALAGMMAKHSVSIYDMCHSGREYPVAVWEEKITDHINYLLLLRAIIDEDSINIVIG